MATGSSILAWRIPWIEEPGGLPSMGSQRVEHNGVANTFFLSLRHKPCKHSAYCPVNYEIFHPVSWEQKSVPVLCGPL